MTWIRVVPEEESEGKLHEAYAEVGAARGKVSNIMRVHSLHLETMITHLDLYRALMFGRSPLIRRTRELLATVVSSLNRCTYCVAHHSAVLEFHMKDAGYVSRVSRDWRAVILSGKERAMLEYAEKLTLKPSNARVEDVEALRKAGLADEEILDVNLIVSYFNFVNRVASGLGVEFDAEEVSGYKY